MCFSVCYLFDVSLLNELYWHLGDIDMNMTLDIISVTLASCLSVELQSQFFPAVFLHRSFHSFGNDWAHSHFTVHVKIFGRRRAVSEWKFD